MTADNALLQKLADIEDIRRIKGLYCDLIDRIMRDGKSADVERLGALFTEDAVIDFSELGVGKINGRAAILNHFTKSLPEATAWMWHAVHSPVIDIEGDRATGRWTLYALAVHAQDPKAPPFATYGRYMDTFRRTRGTWQQSSLHFMNETR